MVGYTEKTLDTDYVIVPNNTLTLVFIGVEVGTGLSYRVANSSITLDSGKNTACKGPNLNH